MDLLVSFRVPLIVSYKEIPFYRKTHKTGGFLNGYIVLWTDLSTTYQPVDKGRLIGYTRLNTVIAGPYH